MTSSVSFEVLDLRHFAATALRALLESESEQWKERLHWDFHPSIRLLSQYLDNRLLPGYAAIEADRIVGYVFCVYEESKAVVGDVFAAPSQSSGSASEVENTLLRHLCEMLVNSPHIDRVESQLLLHASGAHHAAFDEAGFAHQRRLFLVRTLDPQMQKPRISLPDGLMMRPWRDSDLQTAGKLICEAYRDHPDGVINDQYRTTYGSQRFLHNIVRYSGCGAFAPAASFVIEERTTQMQAGLVLGSRVSPESGHITQLCVHPRYRNQGLARALLAASAYGYVGQEANEISLTVTESNTNAVELYLSDGFERRRTFDAAVWERRRRI
jgi:ribosomal protein S18 acetylase RimI-like enzyme